MSCDKCSKKFQEFCEKLNFYYDGIIANDKGVFYGSYVTKYDGDHLVLNPESKLSYKSLCIECLNELADNHTLLIDGTTFPEAYSYSEFSDFKKEAFTEKCWKKYFG